MKIENAVVLVTGASRGLGRVYAEIALQRGAKKVYACAREPKALEIAGAIPLKLDVTQPDDARQAAAVASDVTLVINNAGIAVPGGVSMPGNAATLRQQIDTNLFGALNVAQAFAPVLAKNGGGAIVNMLSALSWVGAPTLGGYSVSKAGAWMMTNVLRNDLRSQGTLVVGVHAGFIDTDMAAGFPGPKVSPAFVANQVFDAVEAGEQEVLADESARRLRAALSSGVYLKALSFT